MQDFRKCKLRPQDTLRDALRAIDSSGLEIALAVDDEDRLIGTLTDGDIRRALLAGRSLDVSIDPFVNRNFGSVPENSSRATVLDLMQAKRIKAIPIINAQGHLVGLHTLHEILGYKQRPNWVVIMAGGRGERLRPLTDHLPKPMLRIAGRPILERIVLHLVGSGIQRIYIAVNYMAGIIEDHFGDGNTLGCDIRYLHEKKPLGTGGALSLLPEQPENTIVVVNGDLLTQFNVGNLLEFNDQGQFKATVGVYDYHHTVPYGVVEREGDRITGLREKPTQSWLANAGIYALKPELVARVPKDTYFPLPALVEECIEKDEPVGAFRFEEDWIDLGHPKELRQARGEAENS